MTLFKSFLFVLTFLFSHVALAERIIGLSVQCKIAQPTFSRVGELKLTQETMYNTVENLLIKKGWKVVDSSKGNWKGKEAQVVIQSIQNVDSPDAVGFAVSIGMISIKSGPERNVANVMNSLVATGGPVDAAAQKLRGGVVIELNKWVDHSF